ncbi:MAG: ribose-phosphate pyrophosphokinase [Gammaproteobacteria bacterium]|nr:ribose-phosphate pyrophosphokinase [Gammaproteobacteria bacterium]
MSIQITTTDGTIIPVKFLQFSGGERHVQLEESVISNLKGTMNVRADMHSSNDIMDYLLLENVLFELGLSINLEIPYFPYARQDRACATGQAFSLDVMTKLLNTNGLDRHVSLQKTITVWDCHSEKTTELLKRNTCFNEVINISPAAIIQQSARLVEIMTAINTVLICPDHGAIARTNLIAESFTDAKPAIICCEKQRNPLTGKILNSKVNATDLTGRTAVITDDICDGGATFIGIAQELRKLNCQHIVLYVTHGIFSRGLEVFDGLIDQIFTTNSFPQQPSDLLTVINFSTNN